MQEYSLNETLLSGHLPDMAAVYGVISRLGSLVIPLISVMCIEESEGDNGMDGPAAIAS